LSDDFGAFLRKYPDAVQNIATTLRNLIFATLSRPQEMIDVPGKIIGYGFGPRYVDMICTIIPSRGGMKLGLAYSASFPDPRGLLEGSGKVHRHVNFKSVADIKRPGVKSLLKAALKAQQTRAVLHTPPKRGMKSA
jgi:hypothetical protein